ncbi:MAG: hypothetical protein HJJLKODD_01950 [Phycisphaerae bacterium]|nr:hypothetical protein [Phycisphaerae bacterium]
MGNTKISKLSVRKETLRTLESDRLQKVAGGAIGHSWSTMVEIALIGLHVTEISAELTAHSTTFATFQYCGSTPSGIQCHTAGGCYNNTLACYPSDQGC